MYHWELVEALFKENPLVKQHIDSYNEFVNNKIHTIIQELNEEQSEKERVRIKFHKVRLEKPTVIEADGSKRKITPNEARLRNRSYSASMYVDLSIIEEGKEIDRDEIYIGEIPVMVKSDLCHLKGLSKEELIEKGEDPYEQGGFFIISGSERVLVAIEDLAPNRLIISKENKVGKEIVSGRITSVRKGFRARTVLERKEDGIMHISFPASPKNLNLFMVLKALGFDTPKKIKEAFSDDKQVINDILLNLEQIEAKNQEEAIDYIGKKLAAGQMEEYRKSRARYVLDNFLLPHLGVREEDRKKKAYYLASVTEKMIEVAQGKREEDDRDNYTNKRLKITGVLMEELFRTAINAFIKDIKYQIDRAHTRGRKMQIKTLTRPDAMTDRIRFAMGTGQWVGGRTGVSQLLDRTAYMATVSHLRRVLSPLSKTQQHFEARDLHPTHLGKICPNETPEGQSVGLVKNLAIGCFISTKETQGLEKEFSKMGVELIKK